MFPVFPFFPRVPSPCSPPEVIPLLGSIGRKVGNGIRLLYPKGGRSGLLTAGIPSFSHRQLIGNFHHSCCYIWTREMEKGKDDDSEQVFPLRISAGIFPQPAETNSRSQTQGTALERSSSGHSSFLFHADSRVEGWDNLRRCTNVTQRNKNHKCHLRNPWDALGMFFFVRGYRKLPLIFLHWKTIIYGIAQGENKF